MLRRGSRSKTLLAGLAIAFAGVMACKALALTLLVVAFSGVTRANETNLAARRARGREMTIEGAVLTAVGAATTILSFIPFTVPCKQHDDVGGCGIGAAIQTGIMAGSGTLLLGIGIPLLAVGVREQRAGLRIDSIAPIALPQGGGVGLAGRF